MRKISAALFSVMLAAGAAANPVLAKKPAADASPVDAVDMPAAKPGVYAPDPKHHHILFSYNHQGFSTSWVRWRDWTGALTWDPANPEKSSVKVTINTEGVDSGVDVFDGHLKSEKFFDAAKFPTITFESTSLKRKGPNDGVMTGNLTIKGVTKPVTLDVKINNAAYDAQKMTSKLGFSAKGVVKRSDWGLDAYVPFVGDEVTLTIESEFLANDAPQ